MASSALASPRQRISSADLDAFDHINNDNTNGSSRRLSSSEIPRTYSGLYGAGVSGHGSVGPAMPSLCDRNDNNTSSSDAPSSLSGKRLPPPRTKHNNYKAGSNLLPFELSRNRNTDWIAEGGPSLLLFYLLIILVVLLTFLAFVPEKLAWTLTNIAHAVSTMVYLHWIKGNPADYMDGTQGEMNAMTCWEQIVSKPAIHHLDTRARTYSDASASAAITTEQYKLRFRQRMTVAIKKLRSRDVLCVIPTLLAHASCHVARYQSEYVLVNVGVWSVIMLPKMPFMNGVRLFGINRTIGIDDGAYETEDDDDGAYETEEDSTFDESLGLEITNEEAKKTR
mmetsp:Transcript_31221/g.48856  ORF Transcript_31221/g.48856 Transcript_31221/m.48856 type:complete len:338 (+) Transcript_31221:139-1152(+)